MLKLGITGFPLTYTKSPELHRRFLVNAKLKGSYDVLPFDPTRGKKDFFKFLDMIRRQGYAGLNVTIPLKEWAFDYAAKHEGVTRDFHGRCAYRVRAANTLVFKGTQVRAANTDAEGLWSDADKWLKRARVKALEVLIVGTGGSARGALAGILERHSGAARVRGVEIWGRDRVKASKLQRLARGRRKSPAGDSSLPLLVLWCLPPLARGRSRALWLELTKCNLKLPVFLYDLNYGERARETAGMVSRARRREGAGMLRGQAKASFSLWRA